MISYPYAEKPRVDSNYCHTGSCGSFAHRIQHYKFSVDDAGLLIFPSLGGWGTGNLRLDDFKLCFDFLQLIFLH